MSPPRTPRLAPLAVTEWTGQDRALLRGNLARADRYLTGDPEAPPLPPILGLFAHHPQVTGPWLAFSGALLDQGALDPRDRELLILHVGARTRSGYQWTQHQSMARAAGLSTMQIAAVADGSWADAWTGPDRDLLHAADQLLDDSTVDDLTWARLADRFDQRQLLELLFVVGAYTCLAMVLNSVGLQSPDTP